MKPAGPPLGTTRGKDSSTSKEPFSRGERKLVIHGRRDSKRLNRNSGILDRGTLSSRSLHQTYHIKRTQERTVILESLIS